MPRGTDEVDLGRLFKVLRRNWWILLLATLVGTGLGIAHVATTTPLYTAQVDLSIGRSSDDETFRDFSGVTGAQVTEAQIQTELQVLRSERIAERVVRMLDLHNDSAFSAPRRAGLNEITGRVRARIQGALSSVLSAARTALTDTTVPDLPPSPPAAPPSEADLEQRAIERTASRLRGGMSLVQVPNSRVVQIRYTSTSSALSARIANAIAQAYIDDQMQAIDEASQRAIDWLRERRDQLRAQSEQALDIAEQFRIDNDLLGVDLDRAVDSEFQRLTASLVAARAELVELEASSRRLNEIVATEDTGAVVRETATQGITSGLRARYLDVLSSYNNLVATLGPTHAQTQRRLRELQDIERLMFEEIRRTADLVRDDIRAARERITSLEVAQARLGERVGADQAVLAELRELERNAEAITSLYINFEQRFQEATQRQEIPISFARILNRAQGGGQTWPNASRLQTTGGLVGFILALMFVLIREWRDNRLRTEEQIRADLGLEYLGALTLIKASSGKISERLKESLTTGPRTVYLPARLTHASDNPSSGFAETLRSGKMGLSLRHGRKTRAPRVGFMSCFPAEGKTTVAANFGNLLARQGARVMLIDGDMRNPGLTRAMDREFETGLVDILMDNQDWRGLYQTVQGTGLHVLPNSKSRVTHSAELIGGDAMGRLLDDLEQDYDYVLIDLPPLAPVIDARALLDSLDGVFFVLKWGSTHRSMARRILRLDPRIHEKCYGAFLNMVDLKKASAYETDGYANYPAYYSSYHRDT